MSKLSKDVILEIEKRGLIPRPLFYFMAKRSVFWLTAILSILLGSISVALGVFAVTDQLHSGGRGFDEMPFDDVATALPMAALLLILLFSFSAYASLSRTRGGYRYKPWRVVALAAATSIGLGLLLHGLNVGGAVHGFLAKQIPAYKAYTTIPYDDWMKPEQGRLGGAVLSTDGDKSLRLRDFDGHDWIVDTSAATSSLDKPPFEEGDIAIRGKQTGPFTFRAEFIDPFD